MYRFVKLISLVVLAYYLAGCAAAMMPTMTLAEMAEADAAKAALAAAPPPQPRPPHQPTPEDPWIGSNRVAHNFNTALDLIFLSPAARIGKAVTPSFARQGVGNFFRNIGEAPSGINKLLQGKPKGFAESALRLLINTTLGLFGLFDVATAFGLPYEYEDLGQTLAVWGVPAGPYVVLPFFGPTTVRGGFGQVGNALMSPLNYLSLNLSTTEQLALRGADIVNTRIDLLALDFVISGDLYEFYRSSYLQRRAFLIEDGEIEDSFLEDDF